MHQELLILFWRICDINKKFMYYVLKSSRVLDVLVPILHHLNEARKDKCEFRACLFIYMTSSILHSLTFAANSRVASLDLVSCFLMVF